MKKGFLLIAFMLFSLAVYSQTASDYLDMARSKLMEGNCESAQMFYNVYKKLSNKTDASVESQIRKCNGVTPTDKAVHKNYTETAFGINMKMIWVDGGDFLMGCTSEQEGDCEDDEKNVRRVVVDGFYIGMLEVTQAQWKAVVGTTVSQQRNKKDVSLPLAGVGSNYPMYYVNYDEVMEFCRLLSIRTGKTYTLPTEAQWEYSARGGKKADGTKYAGSNSVDAVAWYKDNSGNTTHKCGSKRANALGLCDMSGNVWEWCKDWYVYNGKTEMCRMYRGGGWGSRASRCRVTDLDGFYPSYRDRYVGFRVVCIP